MHAPQQPHIPPPAITHAPQQPCMPPATTHIPPATTHAPQQPRMPPPPTTMHILPGNHARPHPTPTSLRAVINFISQDFTGGRVDKYRWQHMKLRPLLWNQVFLSLFGDFNAQMDHAYKSEAR